MRRTSRVMPASTKRFKVLLLECHLGPAAPNGGLQILLLRWAQQLGAEWDVTLGSLAEPDGDTATHQRTGETFRRHIFHDLEELATTIDQFDAISAHQWYQWVQLPERTMLMLHSSIEECFRDEAAVGFASPEWQQVVDGLRKPRLVATCAKWASDSVKHHTGRDAVTLHPGVADEYFTQPAVPAPDRRRVVACSGRMTRRKGVDVLLDLAENGKLGDLQLELPSLGAETDLLQRARTLESAGGRVRVIEPLRNEHDHAEYIRNVAVVAVPSTLEGFGMIAAEAQAAGVPVVGVAAGGLLESILPGGGTLVPPNNPDELASSIREMADTNVPEHVRAEIADRFSISASTRAKRAALLSLR